MTQAKKVVKATVKKPEPAAKDSTEIDDLFSALSSAKKAKTEPSAKKSKSEKDATDTPKDSTEVTLSELEDLESEDDEYTGDDSDAAEVVKGTPYDPKKDDAFPATAAVASMPDSDFFDSRGLKRKTRALTEDGFPIFTPNELKIGMGGGTDLCPFDCNCCY